MYFFSVWTLYFFNMVLVFRSSNCTKGPCFKNYGSCQGRLYFGFLFEIIAIVDHGFAWYDCVTRFPTIVEIFENFNPKFLLMKIQ